MQLPLHKSKDKWVTYKLIINPSRSPPALSFYMRDVAHSKKKILQFSTAK